MLNKVDYFKVDYIKCGDCVKLLKEIPDNSVDLILTDPPYLYTKHNVGRTDKLKALYEEAYKLGDFTKAEYFRVRYNTARARDGIRELSDGFDLSILDEFERVMKKTNIYIWCSKEQVGKILNYYETKGKNTDILTWHKTNVPPLAKNAYLSDTEYCIFVRDRGVKVNGSYDTKKKWYVTTTNKKDKELFNHPTIKPLDIIKNLIINSTQEGDLVLDPFIGSGTTAVASIELNRHYIGFDINQEYCDIAESRIKGAKEEGLKSKLITAKNYKRTGLV